MKTFEQIALECMQRASEKRKLSNYRTLIEPKHQRLEREMFERSRPINEREKQLLATIWNQVTGK